MLVNCMSMAREEERMIKVKVTKLEGDLQLLRLEASVLCARAAHSPGKPTWSIEFFEN